MTFDIVAIDVGKGSSNPLDHKLMICPSTTKLLQHGLLPANAAKGGKSRRAKITAECTLNAHVKILGIRTRCFLGTQSVDGGVNLIPLPRSMETVATTVVPIGVEDGSERLEAARFDDSPAGFDV